MASRKKKTISGKTAELALAVPSVVAHRLTRMAIAGPNPSRRDQKEFQTMVSEKQLAFSQAWSAMAMQAMRANMGLATSFWRAFSLPPANFGSWGKPPRPPRALASKLQKSALGVMEKGIAPIHSKAVANAKRLAKTRLR